MSVGGTGRGAEYHNTGDANINDFYVESFEKDGKKIVILGYQKDLGKGTKFGNLFRAHEFKYGADAVKAWDDARTQALTDKTIKLHVANPIIDPKIATFVHTHFKVGPATRAKPTDVYIGDDQL